MLKTKYSETKPRAKTGDLRESGTQNQTQDELAEKTPTPDQYCKLPKDISEMETLK